MMNEATKKKVIESGAGLDAKYGEVVRAQALDIDRETYARMLEELRR